MSTKVSFPKDPKASPGVKSLIHKILAPLKSRIRISGIRNDEWFIEAMSAAGSSKVTSESVNVSLFCPLKLISNRFSALQESDRRLSIPSDEIPQPKLITKDRLKAEGKPKDKTRRSTVEETPVSIKNPSTDSDDSKQ